MTYNILSRCLYRQYGKQIRPFHRAMITTSHVLQKKIKALSVCAQEEPLWLLSHQRFLCNKSNIDIKIVSYEDVKDLPNQPHILLIDVREPREIQETGRIPTSINIPLGCIKNELAMQTNADEFESKYGRTKPNANTVIIFSCQSGKRAQDAAETAVTMGYTQVTVYKGSYTDWYKHQ